MKKLKVLNLYAGIGGNRKLWDNVEVTAVERDKTIAKIYQDFFPEDQVLTYNAHKFLIENYDKYDFIWSSPPCPTHSTMRNLKNNCEEVIKKYPNMQLYEEIIYLKHFFRGTWVVENVVSYYEPLIKPYLSENHYFWSNFHISNRSPIERKIRTEVSECKWGFDLKDYLISLRTKDKLLNNLVNPNLGLHIFKEAFKIKQKNVGDFYSPSEFSKKEKELITVKRESSADSPNSPTENIS